MKRSHAAVAKTKKLVMVNVHETQFSGDEFDYQIYVEASALTKQQLAELRAAEPLWNLTDYVDESDDPRDEVFRIIASVSDGCFERMERGLASYDIEFNGAKHAVKVVDPSKCESRVLDDGECVVGVFLALCTQ